MKQMLINGYEEGESRVAIMENGRLQEFFMERASHRRILGNIFVARVTNVERGIQAAFVDLGLESNGFLHVSDATFPLIHARQSKKEGAKPRLAIQDVLRPGQKLLVQAIKEESGNKGPAVSTNVSLAGRFMVLMPHWPKNGLSRKISDDKERSRIKEIVNSLGAPEGMGCIVRTAGLDRRKTDFRRDFNYLLRLWNAIQRRFSETDQPGAIFKESELVIRVLRDVLSPNTDEVLVDSKDLYRKAVDFMKIAAPRQQKVLRLYEGKAPIFHQFGVETEIEKVFQNRVELPSGGSIIVEQTEAMVSIDVNSGRYRKGANVEATALTTNLEAAAEIGRQIRLRDLGGLVVIDFIDMREMKNRRAVEKVFRGSLADDRARSKVLRMSDFCLLQMTRQRLKDSLRVSHFDTCPVCQGSGLVPSDESQGLSLLRQIRHALGDPRVARVEVGADEGVANMLLNQKRSELAELEKQLSKKILIRGLPGTSKGSARIMLLDEDDREVSPRGRSAAPAPKPSSRPEPSESANGAEPRGAKKPSRKSGRKRSSRKKGGPRPPKTKEESPTPEPDSPSPKKASAPEKKKRSRKKSARKRSSRKKAPAKTQETPPPAPPAAAPPPDDNWTIPPPPGESPAPAPGPKKRSRRKSGRRRSPRRKTPKKAPAAPKNSLPTEPSGV